jgi:hypothetical protein
MPLLHRVVSDHNVTRSAIIVVVLQLLHAGRCGVSLHAILALRNTGVVVDLDIAAGVEVGWSLMEVV